MISELLYGYENMSLKRYDKLDEFPQSVCFDDLANKDLTGVLKANQYVNGKLQQVYSEFESHVGVIAATRLGKTTSYVIPQVVSFAKQKIKRSMVISDPKGEIYRLLAAFLKEQGYRVILLNFRDYAHSECWNMLTPIFRKYRAAVDTEKEVTLTITENGPRNVFRGQVYDDQKELLNDVGHVKNMMLDDVANDIDNIGTMMVSVRKRDDPYWEEAARDVLKAFLWAMLEDSDPTKGIHAITEYTFSFSTILSILATFKDGDGTYYDDRGYFSSRDVNARSYVLAKNTILENGRPTRKCIMGALNTKLATFRESSARTITSCNSFEMSELSDCPTVVFINYRDEIKSHYQLISLFVQDAYRYLIEQAGKNPNGKLNSPFYFILDEFGNFPAIKDFETTISACAGRNIFFMLIIQSYAQLNSVYGDDVAEIIRDNLNIHVFFGSNNPNTLQEFSRECGEYTRISPLSALNGTSANVEQYQIETIPLVPKSMLSCIKPGECIVTEANCGYVMFSKLERYYLCKEFSNFEMSMETDYYCRINPFDDKYVYNMPPMRSVRSSGWF